MNPLRSISRTPLLAFATLCLALAACRQQPEIDYHSGLTGFLRSQGTVAVPGMRGMDPSEWSLRPDELLGRIAKEATAGKADSQFVMGMADYYGLRPVPKDLTQARFWFLMSAKQGDRRAQWSIGKMFMRGEGGESDAAQAQYWLEKAAGQGFIPAWTALGELNSTGRDSMPVDKEAALRYWTIAFKGGDAAAAYHLGALYHRPDWCHCHGVVKRDDLKAAEYYEIALSRAGNNAELKHWMQKYNYMQSFSGR